MSGPVGAAFCLIYAKQTGRFLMELRSNQVGNPQTWGFFGGGIEMHESPLDAIRRELREEIGIDAREFDGSMRVSRRVWIFIKIYNNEFDPKLSFESMSWRWCDELPGLRLHPKIRKNHEAIESLIVLLRRATRRQKQ
jgi:8-oxo-dGTP pyrophosphatase MutT (NUDIX family)